MMDTSTPSETTKEIVQELLTTTEDKTVEAEKTKEPKADETITESQIDTQPVDIVEDNGIFDFMTPERALELYNRIAAKGILDLEWKFYGRRKTSDRTGEAVDNEKEVGNSESGPNNTEPDITANTEFDFDEQFSNVDGDSSSFVNDSLCLKKRPEPSSDRKTNLNDIMSDLIKESH